MGPLLTIDWRGKEAAAPEEIHSYEWLVTNGLGGYASGTVSGAMTRRYHGLLIAAMPVPLGRLVMLNSLAEEIRLPDGTSHPLLHLKGRKGRATPASPSSAWKLGCRPSPPGAALPKLERGGGAPLPGQAGDPRPGLAGLGSSPAELFPARLPPDSSVIDSQKGVTPAVKSY